MDRQILKIVEWGLLIYLSVSLIGFFSPLLTLHKEDTWVKEARKANIYYDIDTTTQAYYGRTLSLHGVIYDNESLVILMTSKGLGGAGMPSMSDLKVTTDQGEELFVNGGGSSQSIFGSRGHYRINEAPANITGFTIEKERYGEAFSFQVSLTRSEE